MLRKLHGWLWWKKNSQALVQQGQGTATAEAITAMSLATGRLPTVAVDNPEDGLSEALKKKDREKQDKKASRRRMRGGVPAGAVASGSRQTSTPLTQTTLNATKPAKE